MVYLFAQVKIITLTVSYAFECCELDGYELKELCMRDSKINVIGIQKHLLLSQNRNQEKNQAERKKERIVILVLSHPTTVDFF